MSASANLKLDPPRPLAARAAAGHHRQIGWIACGLAFLCVIGPLVDIVGVVAYHGLAAFSGELFTTTSNKLQAACSMPSREPSSSRCSAC